MTGKRFVRKGYKIWDTWNDEEVYELCYRYEVDDICYMLNRIVGENEELKSEIRELKGELDGKIVGMDVFNAENTALMEENEQLQKAVDEADDLIKSHLSSHYNRKWENILEYLGVDLE